MMMMMMMNEVMDKQLITETWTDSRSTINHRSAGSVMRHVDRRDVECFHCITSFSLDSFII